MALRARPRVRRYAGIALAWVSLCACSRAPAARIPVTVVVAGDPERAAPLRALAVKAWSPRVEPHVWQPSRQAAARPPPEPVGAGIAAARDAYRVPDVTKCLQALPPEDTLLSRLSEANRSTVGRALFWRIACLIAGDDRAHASRVAQTFASLDLEMPADVGSTSPEVESFLGDALRAAAQAEAVPVSVAADRGRAALRIDGRAERVALPRVVLLKPGPHVLEVDAEGALPQRRTIDARTTREERFRLDPAPPDVASAQWVDRYASGADANALSDGAMTLLATAAQARNVALVLSEPSELRGVLAIDGVVRARATAERGDAHDPGPLLRELLRDSKLVYEPPIYRRPIFWIAIVGVAAAATATTFFLTRPGPTHTVGVVTF